MATSDLYDEEKKAQALLGLYLELTMLELGRAKPEVLDMFCQLHVINAIQGVWF
jgi:hypothetical protein